MKRLVFPRRPRYSRLIASSPSTRWLPTQSATFKAARAPWSAYSNRSGSLRPQTASGVSGIWSIAARTPFAFFAISNSLDPPPRLCWAITIYSCSLRRKALLRCGRKTRSRTFLPLRIERNCWSGSGDSRCIITKARILWSMQGSCPSGPSMTRPACPGRSKARSLVQTPGRFCRHSFTETSGNGILR